MEYLKWAKCGRHLRAQASSSASSWGRGTGWSWFSSSVSATKQSKAPINTNKHQLTTLNKCFTKNTCQKQLLTFKSASSGRIFWNEAKREVRKSESSADLFAPFTQSSVPYSRAQTRHRTRIQNWIRKLVDWKFKRAIVWRQKGSIRRKIQSLRL